MIMYAKTTESRPNQGIGPRQVCVNLARARSFRGVAWLGRVRQVVRCMAGGFPLAAGLAAAHGPVHPWQFGALAGDRLAPEWPANDRQRSIGSGLGSGRYRAR